MIKLSDTVRVLDFDGSVTAQTNLLSSLDRHLEIVDVKNLGPSLRYLCGRDALRKFESTALTVANRDRLTFLGSGDFHHITASLLRQFDAPLTVVVFDRHADFDRRSPWPCCGSWVADAVSLPHVSRVISIGLGKEDIGGYRILLGRVSDLLTGKIVFFPYDCDESRYIGGEIHWRTVQGNLWEDLIAKILEAIPTQSVYLSVDKDCLDPAEAFTNWEAGHMRPEQITKFIARLAQTHDIVGADITGEYSPIVIKNPFVRAISAADHPMKPAFSRADQRRNETANQTLLAALRPATAAVSLS